MVLFENQKRPFKLYMLYRKLLSLYKEISVFKYIICNTNLRDSPYYRS